MPLTLQIINGGRTVPAFTSGSYIAGGSLYASGSGVSMTLACGSAITLGTTLSGDINQAYSRFITDKREVMLSGGTVVFNGTSQTFESGGYLNISAHSLMSLQGVHGYADSAVHFCNLNIVPSTGFWAEVITVDGTKTILRTLKPCVSCGDYNDLFALEMVVYHAINKLAWQTMNIGVSAAVPGADTYPEGVWPRYQGLVAGWNLYAAQSQYFKTITAVHEILDINIGWSNPTCDPAAFVCVATVSCISSSTPDTLVPYLLFYPGNLTTDEPSQDNNTYTTGDPIPFIIRPSGSGGAATMFCGAAGTSGKSDLLSTLNSAVFPTGMRDSAYTELCSVVSGATVITNVDDFSSGGGGLWYLGLASPHVEGENFAVQGFSLGYPAMTPAGLVFIVTASAFDTYSVHTKWWTRALASGGTTFGPVVLANDDKTFRTYALRSDV